VTLNHLFQFILYNEKTSPCTISDCRSCHSPTAQISFQQPALVTRSLLKLWNKCPPNIFFNFYARKQNASCVFAIVWASVRLSVTLVDCIKTVQARITKSSLCAAPRSLVYRDKISCHWVQGVPLEPGRRRGVPPKKDVILPLLARIMWKRLQIGTQTHAAYHNKHWWQAFWIY